MVMGTCSSAGKSLITTALCRCFARRGMRVAPFKSQNMSNNAAVCANGGEIGRAQALQAVAAGILPTTDMNPILLKPEGNTRSQVVVSGRVTPALEATEYFQQRQTLWPVVTQALDRLRTNYDIVVIEGAGSPAELNLADVEMVNMSVARHCRARVILVGDIERGGVFAQLLGTLWLLPEEDRKLVCGVLVNKFRGDLSLFDRGVRILEERGGVPVLGVLPWMDGLHLPEEDALALNDPLDDQLTTSDERVGTDGLSGADQPIQVTVIHLPHIANFDDFDPLAAEPCVQVRYVDTVARLGQPNVVIVPGTKNTLGDLQWLRDSGLATRILELVNDGVQIIGICGGYQMLGRSIDNPSQLESGIDRAEGLGLLDVKTRYHDKKRPCQARFKVVDDAAVPGMKGQCLVGYEIHVGQTVSSSPWLQRVVPSGSAMESQVDGASERNGQVWGCYLHGLFHNDAFRRALLRKWGATVGCYQGTTASERLQESLDRLADQFESRVDVDRLLQLACGSLSMGEAGYAGRHK